MKKNYVKTYQGYAVPEGATHFTPYNKDEYACFYRAIPYEENWNEMYPICPGKRKWHDIDDMPEDAIELPEAPK